MYILVRIIDVPGFTLGISIFVFIEIVRMDELAAHPKPHLEFISSMSGFQA